ncbi:XRE family transcriptional regulator [Acetobacteraceae bacterium LMG 32668]|uniref:XRE family transcriptional regulator n=1 Tax=Brytella acorum TaxID=2959299 RepID=A0AA35Y3Y0_9PROT|nr:XRE family transcriptional regulator [Brytella acorum]MDF3625766.1 XRE family transcriptional regulator [Brytella acorum]CAI9121283.1 XRE family transcriptional regulator [Brytella acorum]
MAEAAQVSPTTITRLERGEDLYPRTIEAIRAALESAGVEFVPENGGGTLMAYSSRDIFFDLHENTTP